MPLIGVLAAKKRGVQCGPTPTLMPQQITLVRSKNCNALLRLDMEEYTKLRGAEI